jgi:cellulose biosynthesis protein BcsQ
MAMNPPRTKRLVLFNHKGGVGKTTLTVNLAHALVDAGKRVLLVDTDPQCSMSSFFLEEQFLDKMLDESESPAGATIWSALKPVSEGTGGLAPIDPVVLRDGLFLAVGDIRLAEFENSLSECWNLCLSRNRRGYICTAALSKLVDALASSTQADFVFFDAGPNIGPLNRAVVLDCTHFIVPAACDLFSTRALKTLGYALSDWVATCQRVAEMAPDGTRLLEGRPKLLGFVPQGFRIYGGRMAESPLAVLDALESRVIDFVWKPLQTAYGLPTKEKPTKLKLGEVKNFGTLVVDAQRQGHPIWGVQGGNAANKTEARKTFRDLAKRVVETAL